MKPPSLQQIPLSRLFPSRYRRDHQNGVEEDESLPVPEHDLRPEERKGGITVVGTNAKRRAFEVVDGYRGTGAAATATATGGGSGRREFLVLDVTKAEAEGEGERDRLPNPYSPVSATGDDHSRYQSFAYHPPQTSTSSSASTSTSTSLPSSSTWSHSHHSYNPHPSSHQTLFPPPPSYPAAPSSHSSHSIPSSPYSYSSSLAASRPSSPLSRQLSFTSNEGDNGHSEDERESEVDKTPRPGFLGNPMDKYKARTPHAEKERIREEGGEEEEVVLSPGLVIRSPGPRSGSFPSPALSSTRHAYPNSLSRSAPNSASSTTTTTTTASTTAVSPTLPSNDVDVDEDEVTLRLLKPLGQGAFSAVWLARDETVRGGGLLHSHLLAHSRSQNNLKRNGSGSGSGRSVKRSGSLRVGAEKGGVGGLKRVGSGRVYLRRGVSGRMRKVGLSGVGAGGEREREREEGELGEWKPLSRNTSLSSTYLPTPPQPQFSQPPHPSQLQPAQLQPAQPQPQSQSQSQLTQLQSPSSSSVLAQISADVLTRSDSNKSTRSMASLNSITSTASTTSTTSTASTASTASTNTTASLGSSTTHSMESYTSVESGVSGFDGVVGGGDGRIDFGMKAGKGGVCGVRPMVGVHGGVGGVDAMRYSWRGVGLGIDVPTTTNAPSMVSPPSTSTTTSTTPSTSSTITSDSDYNRLVAVKMTPLPRRRHHHHHSPPSSTRGTTSRRDQEKEDEERDRMGHISHPNITPLLSHLTTPTHHVLVLPYLPGGDLLGLVNSADAHALLSESVLRQIFYELCKAVAWMHSVGLVHRDIKLENILLTTFAFSSRSGYDAPPTLAHLPTPLIQLTDFGLSRFIDPSNPLLTTRCGSEAYAAPELVMSGGRGSVASKPLPLPSNDSSTSTITATLATTDDRDESGYDARETDAWACGVVLYALVCRNLPFGDPVNGFQGGVGGAKGILGERATGGGGGRAERRSWLMRIARGEYFWPDDGDLVGDVYGPMGRMKGPVRELTGARLAGSDGAKKVVSKLLVRDPSKRASMGDVLDVLEGGEWVVRGFDGDGTADSSSVSADVQMLDAAADEDEDAEGEDEYATAEEDDEEEGRLVRLPPKDSIVCREVV
ncbi:hypothetical protein ONZ45_g10692 [Pleurotus djamor]|nr:hypothetical protein ONZ45_g10692 [Pleurotus djamor]